MWYVQALGTYPEGGYVQGVVVGTHPLDTWDMVNEGAVCILLEYLSFDYQQDG